MAVSFIGAVTNSDPSGSDNTLEALIHANAQEDDVVVILYGNDVTGHNTGEHAPADAVYFPSSTSGDLSGSPDPAWIMVYKVGATPATQTHTINTNDEWLTVALVFRGVDYDQLITDQTSAITTNTSGGNVGSLQCSSLTPAHDNCMIVYGQFFDGNTTARSFSTDGGTGHTKRAEINETGAGLHAAVFDFLQGTAAAIAPTISQDGPNDTLSNFLIALPPAASGTDATATPSTVAASSSVPAPSVTATSNATVTPSAVSGAASVPAPTVTTSESADVTPNPVDAVAAILAPSLIAGTGVDITPSAVAAISAILAPTITAESNVTISAATVAAIANILAPTVTTGAPELTKVQEKFAITTEGSNAASVAATFDSATTAGNILWAAAAFDKSSGTVTPPSGFNTLFIDDSSSVSMWVGWKVADGTETTVTVSKAATAPNGNSLWIAEYSSNVTGGTWAIIASASNYTDETTVTAQATGTTGATSDIGGALAFCAIDTGNNITTEGWSNSFVSELTAADLSAQGQGTILVGYLDGIAASSTVSSTHTHTGTADQKSAAVAVFQKIQGTDATVNASVVAAIAAVLAPSITAGTGATVTPSTVVAVADIPAPTITGESSAEVTPSPVAVVANIPAPTVVTPVDVDINAAVVAALAAIPNPTIVTEASVIVFPGTITIVATVNAPANIIADLVERWTKLDETAINTVWTEVE